MDILIREAEAQDAAALLEYIELVSAESDNLSFGPGEFVMTVEQEAMFLSSLKASDNGLYLLAFDNDEIVGSLSFVGGSRPRLRHVGEFGITVRQDHWAQGIGTALIQALLDWAKDPSCPVRKINLLVRADNLGAQALYRKMGFLEEGLTTRMFRFDDFFVDGVHMGILID